MKTRYPTARVVATLFGVWATLILVETIRVYAAGPPTGCLTIFHVVGGFSWLDPDPLMGFLLAVTWETASVAGTILMWLRPRSGYFWAGMGYLLYLTVSLFEFIASPDCSRDLDTCGWMLRFFALPVWLFWLCVNDEPASSSPGGFFLLLPVGFSSLPPRGGRRGTTS